MVVENEKVEGDEPLIVLDPVPGAEGTEAVKTDDAAGKTPVETVETLKAQLAEATAGREEEARQRRIAEQSAADASGKVSTSENQRAATYLASLDDRKAAEEAKAEKLELDYETLQSEGKFREAAKISRQLGSLQAQIDGIDFEKKRVTEIIEANKSRPATSGELVAGRDISTWTGPAKQWVKDHKDYFTSESKWHKITAAHSDALAEGYAVDTPEYFAHVEKFVGLKKAPAVTTAKTTDDGEEGEDTGMTTARATATAAPAARDGGEGKPRPGSSSIRLNAEQQEAARISFPDDEPAEAYKKYAAGIRINEQRTASNGRH